MNYSFRFNFKVVVATIRKNECEKYHKGFSLWETSHFCNTYHSLNLMTTMMMMVLVLYLKTKCPHALLVCFNEVCAAFLSLFNYAAIKTILSHGILINLLMWVYPKIQILSLFTQSILELLKTSLMEHTRRNLKNCSCHNTTLVLVQQFNYFYGDLHPFGSLKFSFPFNLNVKYRAVQCFENDLVLHRRK